MNMDPGNPNWEFLAMIREYQQSIEFRPLTGNEPVEDHQITVCVRKRPLNKKELNKKEVIINIFVIFIIIIIVIIIVIVIIVNIIWTYALIEINLPRLEACLKYWDNKRV